jgi:hypothetical protein
VQYGEFSQAVSKSWASVAYTVNTIDTDGIDQRNADGTPAIFENGTSKFGSFAVEAVFNKVDPEFFELVTKQRVYRDAAGEPIGFAINADTDTLIEGFALELWAGAPAGDCNSGAEEFGYFLAPFIKGARLGDYTIENGAVTFTITGGTTRSGTGWGVGPYNVVKAAGVDSKLPSALLPGDHKLMIWTTTPPPTIYYGARPVLNPANIPAMTALVAVKGANAQTASFTFTGATAANPIYIDFGDGTWDYIEGSIAAVTHVYTGSGPRTARAQNNGTWFSATFTLPFP